MDNNEIKNQIPADGEDSSACGNSEKKPDRKKKPSAFEVFRRVMLVICICAFVYFAVQFVTLMIKYIEARNVSESVLGGVSDITKPPSDSSSSNTPIIIDPVGTESESSFETEPDVERPDHIHSEYFSQWLEYIEATKKKYPDFIGYIEIENLDILYPIVQSDDNDYYLNHLIDGTKNNRGEIFLDYRNDGNDLIYENKNIVLYGHNLADGTKFHNLTTLKKAENFYNSPINIITEDGIYTFTIFSFYKTQKDIFYTRRDFVSEQSFAQFCINEQTLSMHESNFEFTGKEVIITLSTCVNDWGGRWCTHAVLTNITK